MPANKKSDDSAIVTLRRGEETIEVESPSLVNRLKSEGWEAAE